MKNLMTIALLIVCLSVALTLSETARAKSVPAMHADFAQELSGAWSGTFESPAFALTMDLALDRAGTQWKAEVKFSEGTRQEAPPTRDLKVQDTQISFALLLSGLEIKFTGQLAGNTLSGTAEGYRDGAKIGAGKWQLSRVSTFKPAVESSDKNAKGTINQSVENETEVIRQVIRQYLDVTDKKNAEGIKKAFHPDTKLMSVGKNGLNQMSLDEWWGRISRIPGQVERTSQVTVLEVSGLAAVVKVDFGRSKDYLSLLKINGEWKIVNKVLSTSLNP